MSSTALSVVLPAKTSSRSRCDMKLSDVCSLLRQTIKDKQEYLQQVKLQPSHPGSVAEMTLTVVRMLDVNIAER